jgi:hypothetical protein
LAVALGETSPGQGLTGAGPQFVVECLVALELALEQNGICSCSKRDPLGFDRGLSHATPHREIDGQEECGTQGKWCSHLNFANNHSKIYPWLLGKSH